MAERGLHPTTTAGEELTSWGRHPGDATCPGPCRGSDGAVGGACPTARVAVPRPSGPGGGVPPRDGPPVQCSGRGISVPRAGVAHWGEGGEA